MVGCGLWGYRLRWHGGFGHGGAMMAWGCGYGLVLMALE